MTTKAEPPTQTPPTTPDRVAARVIRAALHHYRRQAGPLTAIAVLSVGAPTLLRRGLTAQGIDSTWSTLGIGLFLLSAAAFALQLSASYRLASPAAGERPSVRDALRGALPRLASTFGATLGATVAALAYALLWFLPIMLVIELLSSSLRRVAGQAGRPATTAALGAWLDGWPLPTPDAGGASFLPFLLGCIALLLVSCVMLVRGVLRISLAPFIAATTGSARAALGQALRLSRGRLLAIGTTWSAAYAPVVLVTIALTVWVGLQNDSSAWALDVATVLLAPLPICAGLALARHLRAGETEPTTA